MQKDKLDQHIVSTFHLFEGKRDESEDRKVYDKIYASCLEEMIRFAYENASASSLESLDKRLDTEAPDQVFADILKNTPNAATRLNARIRYFVNQLFAQSLESKLAHA